MWRSKPFVNQEPQDIDVGGAGPHDEPDLHRDVKAAGNNDRFFDGTGR